MPKYDFTGKSVLVTGAAAGMGLEESRLLVRSGAEVWMADVQEIDALEQAAASFKEGLGEVHFLNLDVSKSESWETATDTIRTKTGKLDGLINNAGRNIRKTLIETEDSDWRNIMSVNLDSVFYGMKYCFPLLNQGESPAIVNISSIAGMMGYYAPAYATSKWGVRGLSQSAALEFANAGIRVNSVHPGLVDGRLLNSGSQAFVEESLKGVPMNRVAHPEEVAQAVAFLLDSGSSYVTGSELIVDGGLTSGGIYKQIADRLDDTCSNDIRTQ